MQVFVTGASGFIGAAVATALRRAGHEVCGLVRTPEKARALAAREIEPIVGSMEDPRSYADRAAECEAFVHTAAEYSPRYMELDKRTVDTLIGAATRSQRSRLFVYTSGVWVYGDTGDARVDESSELKPVSIAAQRAEHERIVLAADRGALRTIVVRPGCVYGERGSLTADWFDSATKNGAARVVGDGANRWAMVHLHDLADLYVRAVESPFRAEIFNATDRSRFTQHECARAASRAAGAGGKVANLSLAEASKLFGGMAECLAMTQHVDSSKAVRLLGWQPRHGGFADEAPRYFAAWRASLAE
jgi:nucleoside-diphosphate-sugar epimerase